MQKSYRLYLDDIFACINRIEKYTGDLSYEEFIKNELVADAVIRNLEIIGEASKNLPIEIKRKHENIEWNKIIGFRNILIHEYSGVNFKIIWDVIKNKIPMLKETINRINQDFLINNGKKAY